MFQILAPRKARNFKLYIMSFSLMMCQECKTQIEKEMLMITSGYQGSRVVKLKMLEGVFKKRRMTHTLFDRRTSGYENSV